MPAIGTFNISCKKLLFLVSFQWLNFLCNELHSITVKFPFHKKKCFVGNVWNIHQVNILCIDTNLSVLTRIYIVFLNQTINSMKNLMKNFEMWYLMYYFALTISISCKAFDISWRNFSLILASVIRWSFNFLLSYRIIFGKYIRFKENCKGMNNVNTQNQFHKPQNCFAKRNNEKQELNNRL